MWRDSTQLGVPTALRMHRVQLAHVSLTQEPRRLPGAVGGGRGRSGNDGRKVAIDPPPPTPGSGWLPSMSCQLHVPGQCTQGVSAIQPSAMRHAEPPYERSYYAYYASVYACFDGG